MDVRRWAAAALRTALPAAVTLMALASVALAGTGRTFVSSTGNDANEASNCPLANPCRTFAGAYAVTNAGGEIIALDPAGYGPLIITGPVSIVGAQPASITVPPNSNGITITTANTTDTVILRNLQINGGSAGNNNRGITVNSGHLILQNATLKLLDIGLSVGQSKADVVDTDFLGNFVAVSTDGTGAPPGNASGGAVGVFIARGSVIGNTNAFFMNNPGQTNGQPNNTIFLQQTDSSGIAISTNVVSNATVATGAGTGCPCSSVTTYSTNGSFNFQ